MANELPEEITVNMIVHPIYRDLMVDWKKWRLTFKGGDEFIKEYLKQFRGEEPDDFTKRSAISYNPAFPKAAIVEVRNSIYQRLGDITRVGGPESYHRAVLGENGGVDRLGSTMNTFMGIEILDELLVMGKVGIYIDMPPKRGETAVENNGVRPYVYKYKTEDIRCWKFDDTADYNEYETVLLRDWFYKDDGVFGLPTTLECQYRLYKKNRLNGNVEVTLYNAAGQQKGPTIVLNIPMIPFIPLELNGSLMEDIANYGIALLNLASSDLAYAIGANFPFYTEQFDANADAMYSKRNTVGVDSETGGVTASPTAPNETIKVGAATGRRYHKGLDRPEFVHPSPEPMKASMEKQEQLKLDIRLLINLAITNIQPKMASAESKGMDVRGLEAGLSYIGLVLEDAERRIVDVWAAYENFKGVASVKYPEKYSLRSQEDVFSEVEQLKKNMASTPSDKYKRTLAKRIAELLIGTRVTNKDLLAIYKEIDNAKVVDVLVEKIEKDVINGVLSHALAAELRGYPKEDLAIAKEEHIERITAIQLAQTKGAGATDDKDKLKNPGARGVGDASEDPKDDVQKEKDAAGNPIRSKVNKEEND